MQVDLSQLMNAIRSQLYFSQISSWLTLQESTAVRKLTKNNILYRLSIPGETFEVSKFTLTAIKHDFPPTDIAPGLSLRISLLTSPRLAEPPLLR